jgi:two-component system nitrogen regulation sensor histidine kinase GlnL
MSRDAAPDPARVLASLPMAVVLIAPGLTIAAANPAAEQVLGQSAARLRGLPLGSVLAFEEPAIAARLADSEAQLVARASAVRVGGRRRRLDVSLNPVADHPGWRMIVLHEPIGIDGLETGGDAAPLRAPEILAHEIKNPLAGIRGAAQLLARGADAPGRELTVLITAEVDRVIALIDQMQVLSRKTAVPARPCNVHEALRRATAVLDPTGQGRPRVEEAFDPSLPPVLCSPAALVQIMINLLDNARAACAAAAEPRIVVCTRFASGIRINGGTGEPPLGLPIEVRVSDNGPGVAAALGDHIFEPFVSGKAGGQGLGLALVRKLVGEMRGRVTFDRDESGGWTHFRIHLPVAEAGDLAATAAAA